MSLRILECIVELQSAACRRKRFWQTELSVFAFLSEERNTLFDLGIVPCNSALEMQNRVKETPQVLSWLKYAESESIQGNEHEYDLKTKILGLRADNLIAICEPIV
jgi:hypothetical protein